jgi:hypothetical protein
MKLTAVCVSQKPESFSWDRFVCEVSNEQAASRGTVQRARLVAELRNKAMRRCLREYPDTTHVLMIDSYYLWHTPAIYRLVAD